MLGDNIIIAYATHLESRYQRLREKSTEVSERYLRMHGKKRNFLDNLNWFFNDARRAYTSAAERILEERGLQFNVTIWPV